MAHNSKLSTVQGIVLTMLRVVIGWHFLYEGLAKVFTPGWSAAGYLAESRWLLSDFFHWIVAHPAILQIVNVLNIAGLILIGLGLFFGFFTRAASIAGILLLLLYYIANPPLLGFSNAMAEGNYLVVDKNLVELISLCVLTVFPSGLNFGLDRILNLFKKKKHDSSAQEPMDDGQPTSADAPSSADRRLILKSLAAVPFFGAFTYAVLRKKAFESYEDKYLMEAAQDRLSAVTSATVKSYQFASLRDLKGKIPYGQIGNLKISRLFLGGNLIGGWAHSRDLLYVSKLVKAYHHDQKVFETLRMAERCGINTLLTNPQLARVINSYWHREKGSIQFISDCGYKDDVMTGIKMSIDSGAHSCYIQGEMSDRRVRENRVEEIGKAVDFIRQNGQLAGIGAHNLDTIKACVKNGIKPDYWVKTLHHTRYWSARTDVINDNIWCVNPEKTIAFMNDLPEPWIAFKTLAAGAISPEEGFEYAFKNGADFICVGMYDFQIVEDVNLAASILSGSLDRQRPWRA